MDFWALKLASFHNVSRSHWMCHWDLLGILPPAQLQRCRTDFAPTSWLADFQLPVPTTADPAGGVGFLVQVRMMAMMSGINDTNNEAFIYIHYG